MHVVGRTRVSSEHSSDIEDIKTAVARLYAALHVDEHQVMQEQELQQKLEELRQEMEPFEKVGADVYIVIIMSESAMELLCM